MVNYKIDGYDVEQIQLPGAGDNDRLTLSGWGLHCGDGLVVWLPDGWHETCVEMDSSRQETPQGYYLVGLPGICPAGLFARI